jgi:hypothetical protein
MERCKRQIREYAKDKHGKELVDNVEYLPSDLSELIDHLELVKAQGYTSVEREVYVGAYDYAVAKLKYYKVREETDEELELRLKHERDREERVKVRAEAIAMLSPEQRKALGFLP